MHAWPGERQEASQSAGWTERYDCWEVAEELVRLRAVDDAKQEEGGDAEEQRKLLQQEWKVRQAMLVRQEALDAYRAAVQKLEKVEADNGRKSQKEVKKPDSFRVAWERRIHRGLPLLRRSQQQEGCTLCEDDVT